MTVKFTLNENSGMNNGKWYVCTISQLSACYCNRYQMVPWKILFRKRKEWNLLCHVLYFLFRSVLTCLMKTKLYTVLQVKKTECLCNKCLWKQSLSSHWTGELTERGYRLVINTKYWFTYNHDTHKYLIFMYYSKFQHYQ